MDKIDNVILTSFLIKFTNISLFTLYVITCIETSSNEASNAKLSSPADTQIFTVLSRLRKRRLIFGKIMNPVSTYFQINMLKLVALHLSKRVTVRHDWRPDAFVVDYPPLCFRRNVRKNV